MKWLKSRSIDAPRSGFSKCLGGPQARGVQRWPDRREQAGRDCETAGESKRRGAQLHGQARDEIHLWIERKSVRDDPLADDVAKAQASAGAHQPDDQTLVQE